MIDFKIDEQHGLIVMRFSGIITQDEAKDFSEKMPQIVETAIRKFGAVKMIAESSNIVQPAAITELIQKNFANIQSKVDKMAFITTSQLVKMQTKRVSVTDKVMFFDNKEAAQAWITS